MSARSILIADADREFTDSLARALREKQFIISSVDTGSQALKQIQHEKPDLLILDLAISDMSGEDLAGRLKTDPVLTEISIIVLTSKNDLKTMVNCLELGVEEYFVKPMAIEEVVVRINRYFKLMDQWKNTSSRSKKSEQAPTPSDTTADLVSKTLPTINVPINEIDSVTTPTESKTSIKPTKAERSSYGVYRIESVSGTGGMGLVYKAHDQSLDRYVAVKVLSKEWSSSPEFVNRFRKEAKLIAAINHPGIAQIYTFAEDQGESYFALQWCSGGSLATLIRNQGKIELLPALDIVLQCSRALEAASSKGVVHRDIKPSNLMFDENQQVKIVDFGIASSEKMPDVADPSAVVGSPAYMSPEQGRGAKTDHRTDIYSLGITFYQMLYGRLPFSAESPMGYVQKHASSPFPSYHDPGRKVPRRAYQIIEKMTQKNPMTRYQTYSELNKDLERFRNDLYSQKRLKLPMAVNLGHTPNFTNNVFFDLLAEVFRGEKSGVIKVSWGSLQKRFFITNNEIVHFESPQPDESCWAVLVNRRMMKREDIPSDSEDLEESLNRLLYLQAFSPEDFRVVWRELMMQSLMQVFLWPSFEGAFFEGRVDYTPLARIPLAKVLMDAARSMIPKATIESSLGSDQYIVRTEKFNERLKLLNLSTKEHFLASRVEGQNINLETLQLLTGFTSEQVSRTVYALERAGVLKFESGTERRPKRITERPRPSRVNVSRSEASPIQQVQTSLEVVKESGGEMRQPEKQRKWLDAAPQPDKRLAEKKYLQAKEKYEAGQYVDACRLCGYAIRNTPEEPRYHYLMALALTHFPHSTKAAVDSFRQAIQINPENVEYRLQLVEFLRGSGNFQEAYHECKSLEEIAPHDRAVSTLLRKLELEK